MKMKQDNYNNNTNNIRQWMKLGKKIAENMLDHRWQMNQIKNYESYIYVMLSWHKK